MEEDELWMSGDEMEEEELANANSFTMPFTYQGPPGEFRVRNQPNEIQRDRITAFYTGSSRRPVYKVTCNAKAMIHGRLEGAGSKRASLLVYEFSFRSYRGARLKEADISFEFRPHKNGAGRPLVAKVGPDGLHPLAPSEQNESSGFNAGINGTFAQMIGLEVGAELTVGKVAKYYTVVQGDMIPDGWGYNDKAFFSLSENKSRGSGIPTRLVAFILLERENDDDFVCFPTISVTPDLGTKMATLLAAREPDDPVYFSVDSLPFDQLDGRVKIDSNNLKGTDWDKVWDYTLPYE